MWMHSLKVLKGLARRAFLQDKNKETRFYSDPLGESLVRKLYECSTETNIIDLKKMSRH